MTKKDYILIASTLEYCYKLAELQPLPKRAKSDVVRQVALELANTLAENNPKFDRNRFLKACGMDV